MVTFNSEINLGNIITTVATLVPLLMWWRKSSIKGELRHQQNRTDIGSLKTAATNITELVKENTERTNDGINDCRHDISAVRSDLRDHTTREEARFSYYDDRFARTDHRLDRLEGLD